MNKSIYKWRKQAKPQILLDKLRAEIEVSENGSITINSNDDLQILTGLETMLTTNRKSEDIYLGSIFRKSIFENVSDLSQGAVLDRLNRNVYSALAKAPEKYVLLTSVSIRGDFSGQIIKVRDSKIHFVDSFPKKYLIQRADSLRDIHVNDDQRDYLKVLIYITSKSKRGAVKSALSDFDLLRSLYCMFSNYTMELIGNPYDPVNVIRLGKYHTLHKQKKSPDFLVDVWNEIDFVKKTCFQVNDKKVLVSAVKKWLNYIDGHEDSYLIEEALIRYVRALDERNPNTAILKLWSMFESLLTPNNESKEYISKRLSFLFTEGKYHAEKIENIRHYRNANVHSGLESEKAKTMVYELQSYFFHLIKFYIGNTRFKNIEAANKFLDTSASKTEIKKAIDDLNFALDFLD